MLKPQRRYIRMGSRVKDTFGFIRTVTRIHAASVTLDNSLRVSWEELRESYELFEFVLPAGHPWADMDGEVQGELAFDSTVRLVAGDVVETARGQVFRAPPP